jgi:hypothetical protein
MSTRARIARLCALSLSLAGLLAAGSAQASPYKFIGTLSLTLNRDPATTLAVLVSGKADISLSNGIVTGVQFPAGFVSTSTSIAALPTNYAPFRAEAAQFGPNAGATFGYGQGHLIGRMPINGVWRVCLFSPCTSSAARLTVPLGALGGTTTLMGGVHDWPTGMAVNVTAFGSAWTGTGTASHLNLVAPIFVTDDLVPNGSFRLDGRLDLGITKVIPEPGTLTLLGVGCVGLALRGRSKLRRAT